MTTEMTTKFKNNWITKNSSYYNRINLFLVKKNNNKIIIMKLDNQFKI